jgi:hypothetical protein
MDDPEVDDVDDVRVADVVDGLGPLKNRVAISWFVENSEWRTFSATFLPIEGCSAR